MKHLILCMFLAMGFVSHMQPNDYSEISVNGERHFMGWSFALYRTPGFTSGPVAMHDPGGVTVLARQNNGWALIGTENGNMWIYTAENKVFVPHRTGLFVTVYDTRPGLHINPQVVSIKSQSEGWALVDTWQGDRWMRIADILPGGAGALALTFDDGPVYYTERLLDALNERGMRATFFTTGRNVAINPRIAARIVDEGHEIACHSHSHPYLTRLSDEGIRRELTNSRNAIYSATGTYPRLLRPPYGDHNSRVRAVAREFDLALVNWSIDTWDWRDRNLETILSRVVDDRGNATVQHGDIILMHDTSNLSVDAAIRIMDVLMGLGFRFVTVSELFEINGITPEPGNLYRNAR